MMRDYLSDKIISDKFAFFNYRPFTKDINNERRKSIKMPILNILK